MDLPIVLGARARRGGHQEAVPELLGLRHRPGPQLGHVSHEVRRPRDGMATWGGAMARAQVVVPKINNWEK